MSAWELPISVSIEGQDYAIRSDYRAVLDALAALSDAEMSTQEQMLAYLEILYPDWKELPDLRAAFDSAMVFVNCGRPVPKDQPPKPQLVDWERDAGLIAPAIDKVLGKPCRECAYLHWWEFIGAYANIGRGLFAEVVNIRNKRTRGKPLDKSERAWAAENADLISTVEPLTSEEEEFFKRLGV